MAAGASWCSVIGPPPSTTTPGWRWTASWSAGRCRRGPTLDPDEKRLAMRTEDHPIEYFDFEGVIPHGEYGGGDVIIWDWGTFEPEETDDPAGAIRAGELKFRLYGERLRGPLHHRPDQRPRRSSRRARAMAAHQEARRGGGRRLGCRGPPVQREDRPHQRRGQGRRAAALRAAAAPARTWRRPVAAREERAARLRPADDGHPDRCRLRRRRTGCTRSSGTAIGSRRWSATAGPHLDAQPASMPRPTSRPGRSRAVDRCRAGDRGRRGGRARRGGPARLQPAAGADRAARPGDGHRRRRSGRPAPDRDEREAIPLAYMVFDLLYLDGRSLVDVPLEDRKQLLRRVLRPDGLVRYAAHIEGEGEDFTQAAAEQGSRGSWPSSGAARTSRAARSRAWLKIKLRREQEIVVVGWLPGRGRHTDLGSLIVAVNEDGGLRHAGQVGSGIDARMRTRAAGRAWSRSGGARPPLDHDAPAARGALGRAADRHPRRVHRMDARRPAAPGGVQGDRARSAIRPRWCAKRRFRPRGSCRGAAGQPPASSADRGASDVAKATAKRRRGGLAAGGDGPTPASRAELNALDAMGKEAHWDGGRPRDARHQPGQGPVPGRGRPRRHQARPDPLLRDHRARHAALPARPRPLNLQRCPDGIRAHRFWQKEIPAHAPSGSRAGTTRGSEDQKHTYVVADRVATLAWLANQAAIDLHPWTSRTDSPAARPTR